MDNNCPWCKSFPITDIEPLWQGSHGYHDCFDISVKCPNNGCPVKPRTRKYNTIYDNSIDEQTKKAWNDWNMAFTKQNKE